MLTSFHSNQVLRLLFSLKPKEMAKMRFRGNALNQRKNTTISHIQNEISVEIEKFHRKWV